MPNDTIYAKYVVNCYEASRKWRKTFEEQWDRNYQNYRSKANRKPFPWMHNTYIPITHSKVNAMRSFLMGIIFGVNPPFDIKPREGSDEDQAKLLKRLISFQLNKMDFFTAFSKFITQVIIYGTGFFKVYWNSRKRRVRRLEPRYEQQTGIFGIPLGTRQIGMEGVEREVEVYDAPILEVPDLYSIYPEPNVANEQKGWVIHKQKRTLAYLKKMQDKGIYKNVDTIEQRLAAVEGSPEENYYRDSIKDKQDVHKPITEDKLNTEFEIYEWWGEYDLNGDGQPEPVVMTVASPDICLRAEANPFWHGMNPFIRGVYISDPEEVYGIGLPEIMEDLQYELNDIRNQRADNLTFIMNRMFKYREGAGVNTKKLISKPGALFRVRDMTDVEPLETGDVTMNAWREVGDIERWIQEATGITKLTMGLSGSGGQQLNQTATGMQILQQMSSNQFVYIAKMIENMSLTKVLRFIYQLDYQFIDQAKVIDIIGELGNQWVPLTPEKIEQDYDFIPAGVFNMESRQVQLGNLVQFYGLTRGNPQVKEDVLIRRIAEALGFDRPEEIIRSPEEMQQLVQTAAQVAGGGQPAQPVQPESLQEIATTEESPLGAGLG